MRNFASAILEILFLKPKSIFMRHFVKALSLAFISMFAGVVAYAQVTTSALSGKVVDGSGEPLAGAAVIAVHTPSGTTYGAVTNGDGLYTIQGMRTGGPYDVTFSMLGFRDAQYTGVTLQLAETFSLDGKLEESSEFLNEVVVTAAPNSKFIGEKTGASTNISNEQILSLPTVSRSITDMTRLSPYGGNGMSFAGTDGRTANFTVDGANFNNNFGLSSNLPGGGNPISIDAIEEMQVVISPYDVRQTNFIGGGINAVTKSGTNTFRGSVYAYHRNENMRGNRVYDTEIAGARDRDRNTTCGITFGGPIIKNKLFFFVNVEHSKIPTTATAWRASENGIGDETRSLSYCTVADMQRVKDYVKEKYGYDTGSFTEFPANERNLKALARLDWNITDKHHLALRYNYTLNSYWNMPNASSMDGGTRSPYSRVSLYSMSFANSMYSMKNLVNSASLDLNSRISDNLSNQLLVTFSKLDDVRGSDSEDFPFIDIQDGTGTNTQYMSLGYELFTWNNAVHNTIANVKDDLTYYIGKHKIMGGINYEYQMADNQYMRNGTGYYRYASVDDFLNGATPEVVALTYGYGGEFAPAARVQFHKLGLYVQDEWSVNDKFKLTGGLRLDGLFFDNKDLMTNKAIKDLNYYPKTYDYTEQHIDTGVWPKASVTVSPRLGFVYDVFGNKSLKIRGGTGLFSGRIPLVFFTNMPTNSGMVQSKVAINAKSKVNGELVDMTQFAGGVLTREALQEKLISMGFPANVTPEDGTVPSSIAAVDPNFKMPQVWKTSLAIDYSFPTSFPFSVTVEAIYNKMVNDVIMSDWSIRPVEGFATFNGADNRPIYPSNFRNGTKAFVLSNTNRGYGYTLTAELNIQPIPELSFFAAYTHTAKKEITGMPGSDAESAFTYVPTTKGPNNIPLHNSQYVTPDRVVASGTYHDHCGNHFSLIYEAWRGGYNYSYMLANDMNGDGYQYDALYIPTDAEIANGDFRFVSDADRDRFVSFIKSDKYLSKHRGQYAEAYSVYSPWVHRLDFSYKHDFKLKIGNTMNKLQVSFDLKNLTNLFRAHSGVSKAMNAKLASGRILKYEGADADGYATFSTPEAVSNVETWVPVYSIGQCWYASVGLKYMFN